MAKDGRERGRPAERPRVLLVEDDENLRGAYRTVLEFRGLDVLEAASLDRAVELLRRDPDAVVADLGLPGLSGTAVLRRILESDPELPVVVLTGAEAPELERECRRLGAAGYLVKPVRGKELAGRIRELLGSV